MFLFSFSFWTYFMSMYLHSWVKNYIAVIVVKKTWYVSSDFFIIHYLLFSHFVKLRGNKLQTQENDRIVKAHINNLGVIAFHCFTCQCWPRDLITSRWPIIWHKPFLVTWFNLLRPLVLSDSHLHILSICKVQVTNTIGIVCVVWKGRLFSRSFLSLWLTIIVWRFVALFESPAGWVKG